MGGELASESPPEGGGKTAPISISQFFWESLPFYLFIGMSADEFWDGDPKLAKAYYKAFQIREKAKNIELWKQGMYIYNVLCDMVPALHAFSKHPKPMPYMTEPIPFTEKEQIEYEERRRKKEAQDLKDSLTAWAIEHNQRWEANKNERQH